MKFRQNLEPCFNLDDADDSQLAWSEWALIGKVLAPVTVHVQTVMAAMRPAWGNPHGLVIKSVGANMSMAEFATRLDKERVLEGTP